MPKEYDYDWGSVIVLAVSHLQRFCNLARLNKLHEFCKMTFDTRLGKGAI